MSSTMKAISYDAFGGPEQLTFGDQPTPVVGPGEVLIKVRRAAVNPVDWKVLGGYLTGLMPHVFPIIPGWDVAGVVEAVGPDTPEFAVGDEVLAYARKDWVQSGTFAEYVSFSVRGVSHKPAALSWDEAAGLPLAGGTALRSIDALQLTADDTVLIHGAAGGVGSFGVQLALLTGARVIGTASPDNHEYLRELGVIPVDYHGDLVANVREVTGGADVTASADFVGGVLEPTLELLAEGGRLVSIADAGVEQHGGRVIWVRPDAAELTRLVELVVAGKLVVPIASVHSLQDAADALRESMPGHTRGKIIVRVSED